MDTSEPNSTPIMSNVKNFLNGTFGEPFVSVIVLLLVVCACIYNLTFNVQYSDQTFWRDLLMLCIGIIVHTPKLNKKSN